MMRRLALIALVGAAVAVTGCENLREQFSMSKQAPDEFRVVSRAPLTLPPNFALRPPDPGAPRPQEGTPRDQARRTVFRMDDRAEPSVEEVMPNDGRSVGERSLLVSAGVTDAQPNIRQLVNAETRSINEDNDSLVNSLVFWREDELPGVVVDPSEENRRLREAQALGEPLTGAGAPTIERREKGLLEGIF